MTGFSEAIQAAGITPPENIIADGILHRFYVEGDKPRSTNGWYILHDNPPAGAFGCWKRGISKTWSTRENIALTSEEKAQHRANIEVQKKQREAEKARVHAECRNKSEAIWKQAKLAPEDHPYLVRKKVKSYGLKVHNGSLLVQLRDSKGTFHGLQFIDNEGSKTFQTGTAKKGHYFSIGGKPETILYLAEGYATAATIHEATGDPTVVCFDAGNLKPVARTLRAEFPDLKLIICADDDRNKETNTGLVKATEAAQAVDGILVIPEFPQNTAGSDFNDLAMVVGLKKVKEDIAASVEYSIDPPSIPDTMTDMRVAEYFSRICKGKLLYWSERKKWLVYDQQRWNSDTPGGAFPLLKDSLPRLYEEIRNIDNEGQRTIMLKELIGHESHKRQEIVLKAASVIPDINVASSQLDQDPMLLNCLNGTLNLKTGYLQPHKAEDFITKLVNINYSKDAECPEFIRFLNRIMAGNKALIDYLQRYIGYCLTGNTSEQILVFFYGTGANGKTTLANIIELLLGDFSSTAGSSLLMHRNNNSASNDLAALRGARLVKVSEFDEGERLAESTIKTLTGGDRITCRFLYGEFFEYIPQYKILLLGNYKPKVRGRDHGIWRRIHLLPFNITISNNERDPNLMDKLTAELPGILAWAVRGCLGWQETGLCPPQEVKEEVDAYRHSENTFQQWLEECCIQGNEYCSSASELRQSFIDYSSWKNISSQKFGRLLSEAGFQKEKKGTIYWNGLAIGNNSGQYGQSDPFSIKSLKEVPIEKFTEKALKRPECPDTTQPDKTPVLTVDDFFLEGC